MIYKCGSALIRLFLRRRKEPGAEAELLTSPSGNRKSKIVSLSRVKLRDRKSKEQLGRWGEKRCEKFLKRKGLKTLTRNFSCKTGEIDLVMVDSDGTLVFVEVKTRASEDFSPSSRVGHLPVESVVTKTKQTRMLRTARYFLATNDIEDRPYRFDVITIVLGEKGRPQIRHYENAFVP
jgi:putative endonuclease